jgi:hypothetical protein
MGALAILDEQRPGQLVFGGSLLDWRVGHLPWDFFQGLEKVPWNFLQPVEFIQIWLSFV